MLVAPRRRRRSTRNWMSWLTADDCASAYRFGWLVGNAAGLFLLTIMAISIATARPCHSDVLTLVGDGPRRNLQQLLRYLGLADVALCVAAALNVGHAFLVCYIFSLCLG